MLLIYFCNHYYNTKITYKYINYMFFIESFLVGLYASIVYLIMQSFIKGIILLLFSIGFCKHFAGYFLQMHTYFCNRCNVPYHNLNNYVPKHKYLLIDSTLEGIYFLVVGYLFIFSAPYQKVNVINSIA